MTNLFKSMWSQEVVPQDKHFQQYFADTLNSCLDSLPLDTNDAEENWIQFRSIILVYSLAHAVLGSTKRKHQDWFDENDMRIRKPLNEKHRLHKEYTSDRSSMSKKTAYWNIHRETQSKLPAMKDTWMKDKPKQSKSMQIPNTQSCSMMQSRLYMDHNHLEAHPC